MDQKLLGKLVQSSDKSGSQKIDSWSPICRDERFSYRRSAAVGPLLDHDAGEFLQHNASDGLVVGLSHVVHLPSSLKVANETAARCLDCLSNLSDVV